VCATVVVLQSLMCCCESVRDERFDSGLPTQKTNPFNIKFVVSPLTSSFEEREVVVCDLKSVNCLQGKFVTEDDLYNSYLQEKIL